MSNTVAILSHSTYLMARRRIGIALCTLEDGMFGLFTSEDVVQLLNTALEDLDQAHVSDQDGQAQESTGLDWNTLAFNEDA
jgi:hypothetical protein